MAWGRRFRQPSPQAAPVVEKTPEQRAEEMETRRKRYSEAKAAWELANPLNTYRVRLHVGEVNVRAHFFMANDPNRGRGVWFFVELFNPLGVFVEESKRQKELVAWFCDGDARSVELVKE